MVWTASGAGVGLHLFRPTVERITAVATDKIWTLAPDEIVPEERPLL